MSEPRVLRTAMAPLRVSLAGGGTDVPSFYRQRGGLVVGFAITRYVGVAVLPREMAGVGFNGTAIGGLFGGSAISARLGVAPDTRVSVFSDVDPGVGLGGSGAFLVALTAALKADEIGDLAARERLAFEASEIEIGPLQRGAGRQDHYFASLGGVRAFRFGIEPDVRNLPIKIAPSVERELIDRLALFKVGSTRSAATLLRAQHARLVTDSRHTRGGLQSILELAKHLLRQLELGDLDAMDDVIASTWQYKRRLAPGITSKEVDRAHAIAMSAGAAAARLVGAGGAGYLLVSAPTRGRRAAVTEAMEQNGFAELVFGLDHTGVRAVSMSV